MTADASAPTPPQVELVLSRPSYRMGGTVVGTVRLVPPPPPPPPTERSRNVNAGGGDDTNVGRAGPPIAPPRSAFQSASLYLSGHTRIDPRWHDAQSLAALYGTHPHLSSLPPNVVPTAVNSYFGERRDGVHVEGGTTVCFWATNVVELMELKERPVERGSWDVMRPRPLRVHLGDDDGGEDDDDEEVRGGGARGGVGEYNDLELDGDDGGEELERGGDGSNDDRRRRRGRNERSSSPKEEVRLEEKQLAFTFRSTLPADGPPSAKTASARYFYSAVVCAETKDGELIIVQAPFTVQTCRRSAYAAQSTSVLQQSSRPTHVVQSAGRVKIGTLTAVAHSSGLPCYISPTDIIRPAKLSVDRNVGLCSRPTSSDVRSMRVTDQGGAPCCALTLVGTTIMVPGGRALVRFDFDEEVVLRREQGQERRSENGRVGSQEHGGEGGLLPCYRVAVSLHGEETARFDDGTARRTRSYAFDAAHADVEPGTTDVVSLCVSLPLDCPTTLRTDLVEIAVSCRVELTVRKGGDAATTAGSGSGTTGAGSGSGGGGYDVLKLEVPCEVVQDAAEDEEDMDEEEKEEDRVRGGGSPLLQGGEGERAEDGWSGGFVAGDIMGDLRMLSLHMMHACALDVA